MSDNALLVAARRPRVLAITSEPPWPLNSGGHLRSYHMFSALAAETDLRIVCPVQANQVDAIAALHVFDVMGVAVGERTRRGELQRLAGSFVRREPYVMYRRHAWPEMMQAWESDIQEFQPDVLYLDHLDSALYRTQASAHIPAVLDLHNVYSLLARRTAEEQTNPFKRIFLKREAALLDRMERRAAKICDMLLAVSEIEADYFRGLGAKAVHVIPNGVACPTFADLPTGRPSAPPTVLFLGTMSWGPNAAAARFLAETTLPQLRQQIPDARVVIVGRDPPRELLALHGQPGVEVTGGVPDVKPFFGSAALLAVPLDAGGGTRLKILEAFAAGLPVVSTAVGAEGIDAIPGTHFLSAERPEFAHAIAKLLNEPESAQQIATAARQLANQVYDWSRIGQKALAAIRALC